MGSGLLNWPTWSSWSGRRRTIVVVVAETHCQPACASGLPAFCCTREGTGLRVQGGVTACVREELAEACTKLKVRGGFAGCEAVWLRFAASRLNREGRVLLVGVFYASPADAMVYRQQLHRTDGEVAADLHALRHSTATICRASNQAAVHAEST